MKITGVFLVLLLLAGCGGESKEEPEAAPTEAATTPTMTMREVCPEVERVLPQDMLPEAAKLLEFQDALNDLSDKSDTESQNALEILLGATADYLEVQGHQG